MQATAARRSRVQADTMRFTAWIWFAGCAAWLFDGVVQAHYDGWFHARLAFTLAFVFLAAGLFYRTLRR